MIIVKFYDPSYVPDCKLTYSVISGRYMGKWIFVRHRLRSTFEIPGGHIEENETSDMAAARELSEETGALQFNISCVSTYSVEMNGSTGFGRLYYADVIKMGEIQDSSEIEEVVFRNELPAFLTYPDIQTILFERVIRYIEELAS